MNNDSSTNSEKKCDFTNETRIEEKQPTEDKKLPKPKQVYELCDAIFFLISIIIGSLYIRFVFMGPLSVKALGFVLPFLAFCYSYFAFSKRRINKGGILWGATVLVLLIPLALYDNYPIWIFLFAQALGAYFILTLGNEKLKLKYFPFDFLKANLIAPFMSFGNGVMSLTAFFKKDKKHSGIIYAAIGLLVGLPVFSIVLLLLSSADAVFAEFTEKAVELLNTCFFDMEYFGIHSILVSLFLFGALFSAKYKKADRIMNEEFMENSRRTLKIAPKTLILFAVLPLLVLYILYVVLQGTYFFSAFSNILPQNFTYAEYARRGFFEISAVSVINLGVIFLSELFARSETDCAPRFAKVQSIAVSAFTVMMIATALSKMTMYIGFYGFTPKRIYTTLFMVFLLFVFLFIIIKRLANGFDFVKATAICGIILLLITVYSNIPYICIKSNLEMYESGKLNEFDSSLCRKYPSSAVIVLEKANKKELYRQNSSAFEFMEKDSLEGIIAKRANEKMKASVAE